MTNVYSKLQEYRLNNRGRAKPIIDLVEFSLAVLAYPLALAFTKRYIYPDLQVENLHAILFMIAIGISWFVFSRVTSMAKIPRTQKYMTLTFRLSRVTFIIFLVLLFVKVTFRLVSIPVMLIVNYVTILFLINGIFRFLAFRALKTYRLRGNSVHNVLVVADGFSDGIIEQLREHGEWGFEIHSIMTNSKLIRAKYGSEYPIYGQNENLKKILDNEVVDEVLYCRKRIDKAQLNRIARICTEIGVVFRLQSSVSPLDPIDFQLKTMNSTNDLALVDLPSNNISQLLKTMGDIYFSSLMLIVLSPLFLLIGLIIKIDSRGPVFFKQERIGLHGRKFKLYKFRTMVNDAEKMLKKLQENNEADGPVFKMKDDPRITKIGHLLRKTGLDELPQLINVVKGEMSLIGPRPPLEKEVKKYKRWQLRRLSVKPGISCTWQIIPDRHNVSFEEWMRLDLGYIDNWNIFKDIKLFLLTFRTFFTAGGH